MVIVTEVGKDICLSSGPFCHGFREGDLVHVFEGTGVGKME